MKRKHGCYGTLSPENAAHPLVQMLTLPNYSTIRAHLYDALNVEQDEATKWSLKCLVPGVLVVPPTYETFLYHAYDTVISYRTQLGSELQQEILSAYKSVRGRTIGLNYAIEVAIRGDAPFHFLQHLWDTHLDDDARKRYTHDFFQADDDRFRCEQCKDGKDIMTFLWKNVFLRNIDSDKLTDTFIDEFICECLSAHFSFSTILWFMTYIGSFIDIGITMVDVYEQAVLEHNYPAAKECYAFLDEHDKGIATYETPSIFEKILSKHDMLLCVSSEIYDFLVFLVDTHGIKTLKHFWDAAFVFMDGQGYNKRIEMFFIDYRATHFSLDISELELQQVLLQLDKCTIYWNGYEFAWFLVEHYPHYLQYLYTHALFAEWVEKQIEKAKEDRYDGQRYLHFFSTLKVPEHMTETLRRALVK